MVFLCGTKEHVQRYAAASGMLVLTAGMMFGNLKWEDSALLPSETLVRTVDVQKVHDQTGNILPLEEYNSVRETVETQELKEEGIQCYEVISVCENEEEIMNVTPVEASPAEISPVVEIVELNPIIMPEQIETPAAEQEKSFEEEMKEEITDIIVEQMTSDTPEMIDELPFLVDEEGMLYDVNPNLLKIEYGVLELPDYCIGIRSRAFEKCGESVEEIYLPETVTVVEMNVFTGLSALGWVEVSEDNPNFASCDGILYTKDFTTLFAFPENVIGAYNLPEPVENIAAGAFTCSSLSILDTRHCSRQINGLAEAENNGIRII